MNREDVVVVLAGGRGGRLSPYTTVLPKPLIPVGDVPILEVVIRQLRSHGFRRLILAVNYRDGLLRSYFGNGEALEVDIAYSKEDRVLGTAGPLHLIADQLPESFVVMNGDILTDLDYRRLLDHHVGSGRALTLAAFNRRIEVADGVIEIDASEALTSFQEKPTISLWVSLGVYALNRAALELIPADKPFGMDDLLLKMLHANMPVNTYRHRGEWYYIGCPQDLERANEAFALRRHRFITDGEIAAVV